MLSTTFVFLVVDRSRDVHFFLVVDTIRCPLAVIAASQSDLPVRPIDNISNGKYEGIVMENRLEWIPEIPSILSIRIKV